LFRSRMAHFAARRKSLLSQNITSKNASVTKRNSKLNNMVNLTCFDRRGFWLAAQAIEKRAISCQICMAAWRNWR
jgi:hypothetical protein